MASKLDERKKRILKVVTDDYISSAEPVGSRTIARRYDLGLSPATIRNEMADLEEGGFLEQPHTSAGRVPSERGYRYYVDALMAVRQITDPELKSIYRELENYHQEIESLIHQTSKILVQMTQYPSLILGPQVQTAIFRHIQLVKLSPNTVLVVIVTDTGYVENKMIELEREVSTEELDRLSVLLNEKLRGLSLSDIRSGLLNEINSQLLFHDRFFNEAIQLLLNAMASKSKERVFVDGATKILEQPEFDDLKKFKPLMNLLEEETRLYKLLSENPDRYDDAVVQGIRDLLGVAPDAPLPQEKIDVIKMGTTVATNALLERRGARTALLTTEGFRDVIEIARQTRPSLYDLTESPPAPLVPRELRFTVRERVDPDGVAVALDDDSLAAAVEELRAAEVEAVAVCFLFSFLDPAHERRAGEAIRAALPHVDISLSSDVLPENAVPTPSFCAPPIEPITAVKSGPGTGMLSRYSRLIRLSCE